MGEASDGRGRDFANERRAYCEAREWLLNAVHELPVGVLWGPNGATAAECYEVLRGLDDFASLCSRLRLDGHERFIEQCRWHFDHYPHYLGRRRHFVDYSTYVVDRAGPMTVSAPPMPRQFAN
ncbi:hypothetical protein Acy02nite_84580 [Actinoplanes cyaneus]|uniref:Uncharacterized protein n=1 Tax=Actinoplanes cyaneus TaxID=52696 RepID=A0A919IU76_9ACTN|nr:hypothetical protein Acy02nite_84580 [Actinoplanes cyaneus]